MKKFFKKGLTFLKSMRFGILLLILILFLSMAGTFIPQGLDEHTYSHQYPDIITKIILGLGLNDVYNSTIFGVFFIALTLNLFMCSTSRFFKVIKRIRSNPSRDHSSKNRVGYFGSWLLHLGILLVIIFYAYGHITYFTESVYGVPGMLMPIKGTDYMVKIRDFNIEYDNDGAVQQYISQIDLIDTSNNILKSSQVAVNEPVRYEGYTFYQTAYGWAAECSASKSGESLLEDVIYEQTSLSIPSENIGIYFNRYYPDEEPLILYAIHYRGEIVKMNFATVGETIKWNQYEFVLENPQMYTYIDVNKMNGQLGAGIGAFLMILGLFLVFFLKPKHMEMYIEDGEIKTHNKERDSYVR